MNKKGDFTGVIFLVVSISILAIFLLIVGYIVPQITTPLVEHIGISEEINKSLHVSSNVAEHTLPTLWMILFAGLMLGLFATSFFIQTHPIFVPVFMLLLVIAILVAIPLSNAYEELSENAYLSTAAEQQSMIGFIMLHLPLATFIIGLTSMIIAFAKPDGGQTSLG